MKLEIFDKTTLRPSNRTNFRSLNFNRLSGRIVLSALLVKEEGVTTQTRLFIARNTEAKCEWLICLSNNEDGMPLKNLRGTGYMKDKSFIGVTAKKVSTAILDCLGAERGMSLLVEKTPIEEDGLKWYRLNTKNPLRKN